MHGCWSCFEVQVHVLDQTKDKSHIGSYLHVAHMVLEEATDSGCIRHLKSFSMTHVLVKPADNY